MGAQLAETLAKVGMPGYELPPGDDRDFLATARTPDKERARLKRINAEFARAFKTSIANCLMMV